MTITPHFPPMYLHLEKVPADLRSCQSLGGIKRTDGDGPEITNFKTPAPQTSGGRGATVEFV